jgi:hypothetical protein
VKELSRRRRLAVYALLVGAALITLLSSLTSWVDRQLLDNNTWRSASAKVIRDPQVQSALSVYLVNELYSSVDVPQALGQRLPPRFEGLAAPLAQALRSPAENATQRLLARPRVQDLFIAASARAHKRLVNVLENKTGNGISTGSGEVTLDTSQLIKSVGADVGLPQGALDKVPPDAGTITLMKSDQLGAAQDAVQVIRVLSVWLLVPVLVMFAAAVYIARGARRNALRAIGWIGVFVGLVLLIVRKLVGNYVIDALTSPTYSKTGHAVWLIWTSVLGDLGWALIFYGVVFVLGAALVGPTRYARAVRDAIAPVLNERQGIAWGCVAFVWLLLIFWGGTHALRTWWGVLLIGALLAAGLVALRNQTMAEATAAGAETPAEPTEVEKGKEAVLT